jgi:hypothetical protein
VIEGSDIDKVVSLVCTLKLTQEIDQDIPATHLIKFGGSFANAREYAVGGTQIRDARLVTGGERIYTFIVDVRKNHQGGFNTLRMEVIVTPRADSNTNDTRIVDLLRYSLRVDGYFTLETLDSIGNNPYFPAVST